MRLLQYSISKVVAGMILLVLLLHEENGQCLSSDRFLCNKCIHNSADVPKVSITFDA